MERALARAREQAAWCLAIHVPAATLARVRAMLDNVRAARDDGEAWAMLETVRTALTAMLPRAPARGLPAVRPPHSEAGEFAFDNGVIHARVLKTGAVVELARSGGRSEIAQANLLAVRRGRRSQPADPQGATVVEGGLEVPFRIRHSLATMRVELREHEPFLRVELAVDWQERGCALWLEHWLTAAHVEVVAERFAVARDERGGGLALLAREAGSWNARELERGGMWIGSLLLSEERGSHQRAYALAPLGGTGGGEIERWWRRFAGEPGVELFTTEDPTVAVVDTRVSADGERVVVTLRECDGAPASARVRCGGRMRGVQSANAPAPDDRVPVIDGESIVVALEPRETRTLQVTF